MAPSSKSEKDGNKQTQRKHKEHVVKLLNRGKLSGQYSQRLFRKLPPRVCVPLKNIVSEEFLRAGHIFLGFTKCGRYVLSYTSDCGEDDDFSFYTYHLYWWEFNLHSRLKQVHHVRLFTGEDIYSDLYLTVCEWPNDHSKIVIFGFNTRSSSSVLMNLMMSDENNRDIYITIASMPPLRPCSQCCPPNTSTIRTGSGECLEHGYMLNSRYQVVYPFPTFQPAFQLKKDQVIFLNTSYSLVACSVSLCPAGSPDNRLLTAKPSPAPLSPSHSHTAGRPGGEFAADLFRRAQGGGRENEGGERRGKPEGSEVGERPSKHGCSEPGYVNYTRLQYRMPQPGAARAGCRRYEDDKVQLPFTVTDLKGRNLQLVTGPHNGQSVCVEQLTLDFEYLINEVIRSDARWAAQFCSFNDYDVVILEVCPETNTVVINIGLLLLAFSNPEEEHCRPNTYHSSLQVSWDLNTGVCHTVGVGDLTEVKGQTSGSVWSSYRKSCVNTVMKWLVPESSSRYINRMTNEALHKGSSLQVLADSDRSTWIIL
ncbi:LOW QUALITY PROTEIN: DDB1- and CUL4-associated factor 15 [Oncorhynchus kisutch]|uniref:LOW QUALITY PROTEIN: DDB1- and CUL4-associated factor 15 n=1 Tax=Oncorhynchus kisutch TaxID=8019 RepID=UPI0012DE5C91|nr:LOW QUALITY PROTEIN: DDB1- and CUL4-associated factor 15 [Oncorhynchus kisutch]